jgi:hypothetical protein
MMPPELKKAFEETHYIVHHEPPFTLRIGQTCPGLDELLYAGKYKGAAFITAWNPYSQQLSPAENGCRQTELLKELQSRSLSYLTGIGQHPKNGWEGEESFLILGIDLQAAKALAQKFEQWAFVWTTSKGVSTLVEAL